MEYINHRYSQNTPRLTNGWSIQFKKNWNKDRHFYEEG